MNKYTINEDKLKELYKALDEPYCFETDGCYCGDFNFQLEENIYLSIYRSCYKSSSTTDGMSWQLHDVELSEKYIDEDGYEKYSALEDIELDNSQKRQIYSLARQRSIRDIGHDEYGNEYFEENEDNRWEKLKEYILTEKDKIENSDDIPQWIFEQILNKMEKLEKE